MRDLTFTILGSGTSAGIPIIGCGCEVCRSDDPRDDRTRCSACLEFTDATGNERVILIDASPDLRQQVLRQGLQRLDAILFTHNHVDHTFGLDDVRRFNAVMGTPIEIHAEERTMQDLFRIYQHIFNKERNVNPSFVADLIPQVLAPDRPLDLHGLRFTPLRFLHGRLPILGFRIEALEGGEIAAVQPAPLPLAYCTDVSSVPPETWPRLEGLQTLVLDMLRFRHHPTHLTVDQAIEIAERVAAGRTLFTHMTHDIRHAEVDPTLPEGMSLAYDGLLLGS